MTTSSAAKPEPQTEPPEHFPGGADAIDDDDGKYGTTVRGDTRVRRPRETCSPAENPAVEDAMPDEIAEDDDKQQEPDDETGENKDQPTEPPA